MGISVDVCIYEYVPAEARMALDPLELKLPELVMATIPRSSARAVHNFNHQAISLISTFHIL